MSDLTVKQQIIRKLSQTVRTHENTCDPHDLPEIIADGIIAAIETDAFKTYIREIVNN